MSSKSDPARAAKVVTPSDSVFETRAQPFRGLYVGGTGNVTARMAAPAPGTSTVDILFSSIPAGTLLPIECIGVKATGTTATLIVGLY